MGVDEASIQQRLGELPTVDAQLDVTQRVARLRTVLVQLSPKCRAAVILQYRHGLNYQEIGAASQRVAAYGEEVPGSGTGTLPVSHGANGVMT